MYWLSSFSLEERGLDVCQEHVKPLCILVGGCVPGMCVGNYVLSIEAWRGVALRFLVMG